MINCLLSIIFWLLTKLFPTKWLIQYFFMFWSVLINTFNKVTPSKNFDQLDGFQQSDFWQSECFLVIKSFKINQKNCFKRYPHFFLIKHQRKQKMMVTSAKNYFYWILVKYYPAFPGIFIVSSVSVSLCFYVSLSLCISMSPLYLSQT